MAYPPPRIIGHGAERMRLVCYARIPPQERKTAGSSLAGPGPREIAGMAVCEGDNGYYIFSCDSDWRVMFDSWVQNLDDAVGGEDYEWVYPKGKQK